MSIVAKNTNPALTLVPPSGWAFVELNDGGFYDLFSKGHHLTRTEGKSSYMIRVSETCAVCVPNGIYVLEGGATSNPDGTIQLKFGIHQNLVQRPDIVITPVPATESDEANDAKLQKDCVTLNPLFIPGREPECDFYFDHRTCLRELDGAEAPETFISSNRYWVNGDHDDRCSGRTDGHVLYWSCPKLGSLCPMIDMPGCQYAHQWRRIYKTESPQ